MGQRTTTEAQDCPLIVQVATEMAGPHCQRGMTAERLLGLTDDRIPRSGVPTGQDSDPALRQSGDEDQDVVDGFVDDEILTASLDLST